MNTGVMETETSRQPTIWWTARAAPSEDTTPCRMTTVTLQSCKVTPVIFHGVVSLDPTAYRRHATTACSVHCSIYTRAMETETSRQPTSWWTARVTSRSATSALRYPFLLSTSSLENSLQAHYWEIQYWFMTGKLISFPLLGNSLLVHYWETTDSVPSSAPSFN